ncbi:MAG TPA: tol-pal system-associated acyl-CoA thioesterase [Dongiaceae bacterium]|nr:tol-pal system-associated acyl-CoA thioesterase [Dongiaceae bacterium]
MSDRAPATHRFPLRVYYEDTDAAGVVYYANYLKFAERARTEMMRAAGADHAGLAAAHGVALTVRRCEIDYLRPARLDDLIEVETRILEVGGAAVDGEQVIRRDGVDLARIRVRLACVDQAGRATRLPAPLRAALARYCQLQERV